MSHFMVIVCAKDAEELERLLAPYDENLETDPHEERCYCVGGNARTAVEAQVEGEFDERAAALRAREDGFWDEWKAQHPELERPFMQHHEGVEEDWRRFQDDFDLRRLELLQQREDREAADPECEECHGTGHYTTKYNPRSKWDWYQVGGRWTGALDGYEPAMDPRNTEVCKLCGGTGKRADMEVSKGCNGCEGTGIAQKWPTQWAHHDGDVSSVRRILELDFNEWVPYAIVSPEGEWHERGQMGWWGRSSNHKRKGEWHEEARRILEAVRQEHDDYPAIVVDCHI